MECAGMHDVRNDNRRSSRKALPINDFSFVTLSCEVSFHLSEAFDVEDKFQRKIAEKC